MRNRIVAFLAALVATVTIFSVGIQSQALAAWSQCYNGSMCVWTGLGNGTFIQWSGAYIVSQGGKIQLTGSTNNNVSSLWHRAGDGDGSRTMLMRDNACYAPADFSMVLGLGNQYNLAASPWTYMNNRISCIDFS
jgi:hypothetical protein